MANNNKHTGPNVPALRFPEFSGEWESRTIGDDCKILMCKRIFANQTTPEGEVPFYKIGTIGDKADAYISKKLFEEYKQRYNYPKCGEVMITCAGTVGKTILYNGQDAYYQDSNIVWISNPRKIYSNEFLNYLLNRVDWSKLNSTTITRIYNDNLRELHITFPSREEQDKIVSLLTRIDDRIDTQSKIIEELKTLRGALNESLYCCCESYQELSFNDVGVSYSGLSGKSGNDFGSGYPFIPYTNIFTNNIIDEGQLEYVQVREDESQNSVCFGDLLMTLSSETPEEVGIGAVYLGHESPMYLNSFAFGIHITRTDLVYPPYLSWLVSTKSFRKFILPYAQGSTRYNLQKTDFMKAKYRFPTLGQQKAISVLLSGYSSKIENEERVLNKYTALKQGLIEQLFI